MKEIKWTRDGKGLYVAINTSWPKGSVSRNSFIRLYIHFAYRSFCFYILKPFIPGFYTYSTVKYHRLHGRDKYVGARTEGKGIYIIRHMCQSRQERILRNDFDRTVFLMERRIRNIEPIIFRAVYDK